MKLKPSYVNQVEQEHTKAYELATSSSVSAIASACVGSAFLILVLVAAAYFVKRRKTLDHHHTTSLVKRPFEKPVTLRKPSAVRSPGTAVGGGITLKKSPSPTEYKNPPGLSVKPSNSRRQSSGSDVSSRSACSPEDASWFHQDGRRCPIVPGVLGNLQGDNIYADKVHQHDGKEQDGAQAAASLGKLHFRVKYSYEKHALCVTISKCTDLPPKVSSGSNADPYVKLQLLPDKQHKVKTRVLRKTLNPVYDEDFTFYGIKPVQLESLSLHFVVLSFDRYSRDDIIGEIVYQLGHLEFDMLEKHISLTQNILPRSLKIRDQGRGEILVSLCHQPAANRLTVVVLKARNLPKMDVTGLCDPYVKIYLLYNKQRIAKKKTHVKKRTTSPVFNESFVFDVPYNEGLENLSLDFVLLDYERVTKNEVIGRLDIGPMADGSGHKHWTDVSTCPRRQIAEWHKLKE
ncbi:Synaptotagmin-4 [Halotydeus destructor]|nr:Synaptotagmin-4 [Halotydeus destructor]